MTSAFKVTGIFSEATAVGDGARRTDHLLAFVASREVARDAVLMKKKEQIRMYRKRYDQGGSFGGRRPFPSITEVSL